MMDVSKLYTMLKNSQEKKGYYFNQNEQHTFEILQGLLANTERYGYMACPCRLAAGDKASDADIICPCAYREADVREYGACYCGLYVDRNLAEEAVRNMVVPERRPPDMIE